MVNDAKKHPAVRPGERGFSLVELVIAMVVMLLVFAAVGRSAKGLFARTAAFGEASATERRVERARTLMTADFLEAGSGYVRADFARSGTEPAVFKPSADYSQSAAGSLTKVGADGWSAEAVATRALGEGAAGYGSVAFTAVAGSGVSVRTADGSARSITVGLGQEVVVAEDGRVAAASNCEAAPTCTEISPHAPGDGYRLTIEPAAAGGHLTRYYRLRGSSTILLYVSTRSAAPAYPVTFATVIYSSGRTVTNITLTGAPLFSPDGAVTKIPTMPMDGETRLTGPVSIAADGSVTVLAGDTGTDATTLASSFNPSSTLYASVKAPERGSYLTGDVVMVVDDISDPSRAQAALFRIQMGGGGAVSGLGAGASYQVVFAKATSGSRLWGRLWSQDVDFNYTFPAGSLVVKLAPPVTYSLSGGMLTRREGQNAPAMLDPGVTQFAVSELNLGDGRHTYEVAATFRSEGVEAVASEADAATSKLLLPVTPPALNQTFNPQAP